MSDKAEFELLTDIAKLLRKYGPETFESLAESVSTPEFSERLASVLSRIAKVGRTVGASRGEVVDTKRSQRDFRSSLVALEKTEPEKSELLVKFYDGLHAKTFLPTLRDIKAFMSDMGFPPSKASTREKVVIPLVKALLSLHLDDLKPRLSAVKPISTQGDRSLEGWSNIILDKERRTREDGQSEQILPS